MLHSPEQKSPLEVIRPAPYHVSVLPITVSLCPSMSLLPGTVSLLSVWDCTVSLPQNYICGIKSFYSVRNLPYGLQNSKGK